MKNIKSIFALILAIAMIFCLAACGNDSNTTTTEAPTEPAPTPVTIGDVTIEYLRAEKYAPFENGESVLVYCKLTNNGTEETSAYKTLYVTAKCGDQTVSEIDYQQDKRPEGMNDYAQPVAPGESREFFHTLDYVEGVNEITIQDLYNQIPEKLVINIDTTTL